MPGADVFELCVFGDAIISGEAKKVYQKKDKSKRKIEKGKYLCTHFGLAVSSVSLHVPKWRRAVARETIIGAIAYRDRARGGEREKDYFGKRRLGSGGGG